jgi:hypothetical protein
MEQWARLMLGHQVVSFAPRVGVPLLTTLCGVVGVRQPGHEEFRTLPPPGARAGGPRHVDGRDPGGTWLAGSPGSRRRCSGDG